ncbi:IQ domain-containing protein IQM1-like isoform X2 [Typha latifolia]
MGLSLSLFSWGWIEIMRGKVLGLTEVEAVLQRSLSSREKDIRMTLRSLSFKRSDSSPRKVLSVEKDIKTALRSPSLKRCDSSLNKGSDGSESAGIERSLSFKNWEPEVTKIESSVSPMNQAVDEGSLRSLSFKGLVNEIVPDMKPIQYVPEFSSPRPSSELNAAATKLQKVYKSYRTRRIVADCAVVIEELWWKALDFASLEHSSVSFFDVEKPETAVSRWARARTRAAKVGKGLSKDEKAQKLALQHWLEAIDPRHRYGHNLHLYYDIWFNSESTQPFFYWLDIGDGKNVNHEKCPRSKLQNQLIKYLGPKERDAYEVVVENGKLVYKQSEILVNTTEDSKWIFVLSTSRTFYVGQKKKGSFQHSSFLAGGATTAAGRLVAKEGVLQAIWPYSGHYLPTEENFKEFISFLEDHDVDLSNVKRCSVDDDEYPSVKKVVDEPACEVERVMEDAQGAEIEITESEGPWNDISKQDSITTSSMDKGTAPDLVRRLSCKWTTGTGARIGCVRDYPADLQSKALEQVNLSPRLVPSPVGNRVPIPSPRPSPNVRLSPRLQYMGIPSPTVCRSSPKVTMSPRLPNMGIPGPTPTVFLTLPKIKGR